MKRFVLVLCLALAACTNQGNNNTQGATAAPAAGTAGAAPVSSEQPLAAESNPPGDIPDTQAFVVYTSAPGGYVIDVPEGWARSVRGPSVTFVDKFDGMSVVVATAAAGAHAPNESQSAIAAVENGARAGRDFHISPTKLPGGNAVIVTYTSNSNSDPVTGKRVRLNTEALVFTLGPKTATVLLWAPLGADNVDQWKRIGSSFRWH